MNDELLALYEALRTEIEVRVKFVTPKMTETNYLEFKQKAYRNSSELSDEDKRNFSKALSAFSNADGGLLIWGVATRKEKKKGGVDYAASLKSITEVEDFAERLRSSLLDTIIPQNSGVRIGVIKNRLGNGYVKCLIPVSEHRPHRAMFAEREYWVRMDGRTLRLEHYQIRDMMTRHANPDLRLSADLDDSDLPQGQIKVIFHFLNTGRTVAKYAGWFARFENASIVRVDGCNNLTTLNRGKAVVSYDSPPGRVIHPNGITVNTGSVVIQAIDGLSMPMSVRCYCEGMTAKAWNNTIHLDDLSASNIGNQQTSVDV